MTVQINKFIGNGNGDIHKFAIVKFRKRISEKRKNKCWPIINSHIFKHKTKKSTQKILTNFLLLLLFLMTGYRLSASAFLTI